MHSMRLAARQGLSCLRTLFLKLRPLWALLQKAIFVYFRTLAMSRELNYLHNFFKYILKSYLECVVACLQL